MRKSLKTGPVTWSYLDNEKGDEIWLTFHGYGQDAEVMQQFMKTFRPNARVLSFDLPLHGNTTVKKQKPLTVGDLAEVLGGALREAGGKSCSVLAFSLGGKMATNGGDIQSAFNQLIQCWQSSTGKAIPWNVTLPVVNCPGNNVGTCEELRGAVNVNIVWITDAGEDPNYSNAPEEMAGYHRIMVFGHSQQMSIIPTVNSAG